MSCSIIFFAIRSICPCIFDNTWCDFAKLVDSVSSGVRKIVTDEKSSGLFTSFCSRNFSSPTFLGGSVPVFCAFFSHVFFWIEKFEVGDNKYPSMSPFLRICF